MPTLSSVMAAAMTGVRDRPEGEVAEFVVEAAEGGGGFVGQVEPDEHHQSDCQWDGQGGTSREVREQARLSRCRDAFSRG